MVKVAKKFLANQTHLKYMEKCIDDANENALETCIKTKNN